MFVRRQNGTQALVKESMECPLITKSQSKPGLTQPTSCSGKPSHLPLYFRWSSLDKPTAYCGRCIQEQHPMPFKHQSLPGLGQECKNTVEHMLSHFPTVCTGTANWYFIMWITRSFPVSFVWFWVDVKVDISVLTLIWVSYIR